MKSKSLSCDRCGMKKDIIDTPHTLEECDAYLKGLTNGRAQARKEVAREIFKTIGGMMKDSMKNFVAGEKYRELKAKYGVNDDQIAPPMNETPPQKRYGLPPGATQRLM